MFPGKDITAKNQFTKISLRKFSVQKILPQNIEVLNFVVGIINRKNIFSSDKIV